MKYNCLFQIEFLSGTKKSGNESTSSGPSGKLVKESEHRSSYKIMLKRVFSVAGKKKMCQFDVLVLE